jgi:hypothetical protein
MYAIYSVYLFIYFIIYISVIYMNNRGGVTPIAPQIRSVTYSVGILILPTYPEKKY